ncbi:MAG: oxidoreductase [Proteobacteria bacterium]|nr:oxidoreductase [Pseudomonadota bacterium]
MPDTAFWAVCLVVVPLFFALICFVRSDQAAVLGLLAAGLNALAALAMTVFFVRSGPLRYAIGGWQAPLGINFSIDGLSVLLVAMTAVTGLSVSMYARGYFSLRIGSAGEINRHGHQRAFFWPVWLLLWGALNGLFLSADLFNVYVTLEIIGLSAVVLTALSGKPAARLAAMRYLLVSLLGSCSYLFGVALLYRSYGILDMAALARLISPAPLMWASLALLTTGLLLKTALFPLHFWLPPAHANALAPVSAILSGLVVKASFYLMLRLWGDIFAQVLPFAAYVLLGVLGCGAVLWGAVQALLQKRLKMLIAYSTVAQLGYLFIALPLIRLDPGSSAWEAVILLIMSHACAKSAMFMAAGSIFLKAGHDRIDDLAGIKEVLPISSFAFVLAGVSLMGFPPSGGFVGKWLLLGVSLAGGEWWWGVMLVIGSLLAAGYVYRVASRLLVFKVTFFSRRQSIPPVMEWSAVLLALLALLLGLLAGYPLGLLEAGSPFPLHACREVMP